MSWVTYGSDSIVSTEVEKPMEVEYDSLLLSELLSSIIGMLLLRVHHELEQRSQLQQNNVISQ